MKRSRFITALLCAVTLFALLLCGCSEEEDVSTDTSTTICGIVCDAATGVPIQYADVSLSEYVSFSEIYYASIITGSNGNYEITLPASHIPRFWTDDWRITVRKDGYYQSNRTFRMTLGKGNKYQIDMTLHKME